jgi:hypothetical protein
MTESPMMSKGEREDLQRLIRQREKVLKSAAKQRSAELLADFENQMGSEFSFDQDEVWQKAAQEAETEVRKAQTKIALRCRELGIPERFAPSLNLAWCNRGYGNSVKERKIELRNMAVKEIAAMELKAVTEIELSCLSAQEQIAISGLTSDAARNFIAALPGVNTLMPALTYAELAGEANPPIAEQLVTPNALRQRRYRERHPTLRNGQQALPTSPEQTKAEATSEQQERAAG